MILPKNISKVLTDSEKSCWVPMPPLERLLMGQCGGKLGSFLTPLTPIYLPVHPEKYLSQDHQLWDSLSNTF